MSSDDCIVISDEEETPNIVGTIINDEPNDNCSNVVCMPEFVSVPSTSSSHMESELEYNLEPPNVASNIPYRFAEISKTNLKEFAPNELVVKINGTCNISNINHIMSVIKFYNFKNAQKICFVNNPDTYKEINVNDIIRKEKLSKITPEQAHSILSRKQKLNVFVKSNNTETQTVCNQPQTVINQKHHQTATASVNRENHEENQRNANKFHQNAQKNYNSIRVKPFDQICQASLQVVKPPVEHVKNDDHTKYALPLNKLKEISEWTPYLQDQLRVVKSHQVIETAIDHTSNKLIQQNLSNSDKFPQVLECSSNMNTEWKDDAVVKYVPFKNYLNGFSEKEQHDSNLQEDLTNREPIQQNSSNLNIFSSVPESNGSLNLLKVSKIKYCIENTVKNRNKVPVQKRVKKSQSSIKRKDLKSFYKDKYKLKDVRIVLSRLEVENYFKRKKLQGKLAFMEQNTIMNANQIFIHDHNFANMTHYYCDETPPNTQLYFVNKHHITTSLYMKNFPLFERAIKTNKIKVINELTFKKYRHTADNLRMSDAQSKLAIKLKTSRFCKFVSNFHCSLSNGHNISLESIMLDHSYSMSINHLV